MGAYSRIVDEIAARLTDASATGKKLAGIRVYVGPRQIVETLAETPSVVVSFRSIEEIWESGRQHYLGADVGVTITVKLGLQSDRITNLYTDTTSGFIYLVEKILDVLNETESQVLDPRLGGNASRHMRCRVGEVRTEGNFLISDIELDIKTADYLVNGRNA